MTLKQLALITELNNCLSIAIFTGPFNHIYSTIPIYFKRLRKVNQYRIRIIHLSALGRVLMWDIIAKMATLASAMR